MVVKNTQNVVIAIIYDLGNSFLDKNSFHLIVLSQVFEVSGT